MVLTIKDIEKIIPHRYPFLLVDKNYRNRTNETSSGHKKFNAYRTTISRTFSK